MESASANVNAAPGLQADPEGESGIKTIRLLREPGYSTEQLLARIAQSPQVPGMILPQVSELLSRVARRPVVQETFDTARRGGGEVRLSGLTDSAKALLAPLAFGELGRPTILRGRVEPAR